MEFMDAYHTFVKDTLEETHQRNVQAMEKAAQVLFACEQKQKKIYTFGTGHSHMIGQDLYARAGGFAKIFPIVEIEMTLATHPTKSTHLERNESYADVLDEVYTIEKDDVIIMTSNSGRNPLVIEYALRAKQKGAHLIAITSLTHSKRIQSRHKSGLRLFECADIVLDNMAPLGDAGVEIDDTIKMGPISTLTGCYLSQCIIGRFVELLREQKMPAPVFRSSNMDGADAYNKELFDQYIIKK
ncbi:SIS domain-containing protein [Amedibacillus sp. YH-ame10]